MKYQKKEIKNGITVHHIETDKFKTNLMAIFLTTPLSREYVTFNSVLASVLRRGSKSMPTQEEISMNMEEMYGAVFDCGLDKIGDNHILKFYLESINDDYLPEKLIESCVEKLSPLYQITLYIVYPLKSTYSNGFNISVHPPEFKNSFSLSPVKPVVNSGFSSDFSTMLS